MMDKRDFMASFKKWKDDNGYKREQCREKFRQYRDNAEKDKVDFFEYILSQPKPASFLDSLFEKNSEIKKQEKAENEEKQKQRQIEEKENELNKVLEECYEYIKLNNLIPNLSEIENAKKVFGTEEEMLKQLENKYQDLSSYILNENSFNQNYNKKVIKKLKEYNRYIITTAVSNKKVNKNFLNSLKTYCEYNNALLLILPCQDVANRSSKFQYQLDPILKDYPIIYNDTFLNENLMISDIKMSAKHINPQSGLGHLCREKSVIVASTKQELDYIPNFIGKQPHCLMTTGAITIGNYDTDAFMSKRTSKLAQYDHVTGAIVVELEDNKIFHFRQIQADKEGKICDLGNIYSENGINVDNNVCGVLGDLHGGSNDLDTLVLSKEIEVLENVGAKKVVLHDIMSSNSISHWTKNKTITKAQQYHYQNLSLENEAEETSLTLRQFQDFDEIYIVRSNHDNFLTRYLEDGLYAKDPINLYYSLDIVKAFLDKKDPFEYMIKYKTSFKDFKNKKKYKFLQKYESKQINNTEISLHGANGANGAKGNDKMFNKTLSSAVIGHSHVGKIHRGIFTVGTSTKKKLDYIVGGLSSWTHTMCLIYSNGTKQLINIIEDKDGNLKWKL